MDEIETRKYTLFLDQPLENALHLLIGQGGFAAGGGGGGGATGASGGECVEKHETFVYFWPAIDLAPWATEFQIHHHAEAVNVHVRDAVHTKFALGENPIQGEINYGNIGDGYVFDVDLHRPLMHSLSCGNLLEPRFL